MAAVLITYGILLLIYFVLSRFDGVSSWMEEAKFEDEGEDAPQREDGEYKWSDNIKGYKE